MPAEDLHPAIELYHHRFLHALREAKLISPKKLADLLIPPPPKQSAGDMRPLWRDLILQDWGGDPLQCPLGGRRLVGVLDGGVAVARRVSPPAGRANQTMEPIEPPWQAIKEWIADAPLWPYQLQDPPLDLVFHDAPPGCGRSIPDNEPDLDWFNRPWNPQGEWASRPHQYEPELVFPTRMTSTNDRSGGPLRLS